LTSNPPSRLAGEMDDLSDDVASVPLWWHSIDLGDGVVTPGHKSQDLLEAEWASLCLPDLSGKTVLDIGGWDGWFGFRAEREGASRVVVADYRSGNARRGFDIAKQALKSAVSYVEHDFMHDDLSVLGSFEIVLFLGVLYHLRDPIVGMERVSGVTSELAVIETEAVSLGGNPSASVAEFYPTDEYLGDSSNWWAPSLSVITGMAAVAGFASARSVKSAPTDVPVGELRHYRAVVHAVR
jgi:tRNA (mo5U34)-methyltransferase